MNELDQRSMGAIPAAVLARPGRVRGDHPMDSFTAAGPIAGDLAGVQKPLDVYAPLRALIQADGVVVLMGVGLNKLTLLHLAEKDAGRVVFRRWANSRGDQPIEAEEGGCSEGFPKLMPVLALLITLGTVGESTWRIMPARAVLESATQAIRENPSITRCDKAGCLECYDAVLGGPLL